MKNNLKTKFIGNTYILDNGRWVNVYGMDLDPHDPNYLLFTPKKSKSDEKDNKNILIYSSAIKAMSHLDKVDIHPGK
jgi:hypothetical protein